MWHIWVVFAVGVGLMAFGVFRFARDRRRLSNTALVLVGATIALPMLMLNTANPDGSARTWHVLLIFAVVGLYFIGYPLLTLFLLVNGVTMLRKERRSLGNALSLLVGVALAVLPVVLWALGSIDTSSKFDVVFTALVLVIFGVGSYLGFCFVVFLASAIAYRRVPRRTDAGHVIVLGSGLIGSRVPPLLASRLRTGQKVADAQTPPAVIIPSGGQGADEDTSEGAAMAAWLQENGTPAERILVEDRARTTRENLEFSRALLPSPSTPTIVVTTSYHVFRAALLTKRLRMPAVVVGAPTASYYVPSAFLREWVAVMRENALMHVVLVALGTLMVAAGAVVSLMPF
ncbi:YdcF family protein [Nocardioides yefusunii]|uniref:YdcF family protein n=1 Tax=Nocardioides yefusunii TaxID=2500546 RepID=A0ABW1QXD6_9ACTN|nr:YdcF family protein [Nocardioides yefusunii]